MPNLSKYKGFCDLSIVINDVSQLHIKNMLHTAVECFEVVALNRVLDESVFEGDKKKKKKKGEPRDTPDLVPPPLQLGDLREAFREKLTILQRLTFTFTDNLQAHKVIQSENVKKYDLLAVIPTTETAFQHVCTTLEADIVSFDPVNKPVWCPRKLYNLASERGLFFELMYAPAILDTTSRRNIIQTAHGYHSCGKSKNIIISSGASKPLQIRGPYDILCLGLIFGLSEEQSKTAITSSCRALLIKAEGRRYGKTLLTIQLKTPSSPTDSPAGDEMEVDIEPAHKRQRPDDS
ncbi:ribonuclease P protein subunit p30 isoform X1 [Bacillus rossius redtenbacheri]|uniref:ribonuclease P protein subunit p30 isoform X1 n=1 Tax=Bacillus rossius redtenbacheri TaxID=93214 RepID=UPI002FDD3C41